MKLPKTASEVQNHGEKSEADMKEKDEALLEKKYAALERNNTRIVAYFQKQAALQTRQELNAAKHKARVKKTALAKWVENGGSPSDFEAAWTVIYEQILQTKTIQKIVKQSSKHFSL